MSGQTINNLLHKISYRNKTCQTYKSMLAENIVKLKSILNQPRNFSMQRKPIIHLKYFKNYKETLF